MKLYEFHYIDKQNLSESDLLERIQRLLEKEAEFQGWALGYNFRQCKEVQRSGTERIFHFEVLGDYIDSSNADPKSGQNGKSGYSSPLAAKEISP